MNNKRERERETDRQTERGLYQGFGELWKRAKYFHGAVKMINNLGKL